MMLRRSFKVFYSPVERAELPGHLGKNGVDAVGKRMWRDGGAIKEFPALQVRLGVKDTICLSDVGKLLHHE